MLVSGDRNKKNISGARRFVIVIIISIGLLAIGYYLVNAGSFDIAVAKAKGIFAGKDAKASAVVELDASKQYQFDVFNDIAIICDRDFVRGIGQNGAEKWKFMLNFSSPIVNTSNKNVLVADKGANTIRVFDSYGQKSEIITEDSIIDVRLGDGHITAVTKQKGYKGAIFVYTLKGELLFKWMSGNANVISASLSPDGKCLATSVVDTSSGKLVGGVMMFDIKTDSKPFAGLTYPDCLVSAVEWGDNGMLIASGDRFLTAVDRQGREKWKYDYAGRILTGFDIKSPKQYILAFNSGMSDTGEHEVEFIDGNGKKYATYKTIGEIKTISTVGGDTVIAGQREIVVVGRNGVEKKKLPIKFDIRYIKPFPFGGRAIAVSGAKVEFIDI